MTLPASDAFATRHIGPRPDDRDRMLQVLRVSSLEALIDQVVPSHIRRVEPLVDPAPETEAAFLARLRTLEQKNARFRTFIGAGYYGTVTPAVIQRMVLENPGWYTPYTPYQAEIAQGRLEALLTFQTTVSDLTGMEVANASLLDEATAAAEAMTLLRRVSRKPASAQRFLVVGEVFPQVRELLISRAEPLGIRVDCVAATAVAIGDDVFGVLVQYPDGNGQVVDIAPLITQAHEAGALVAVGSDLLALTMLVPPGEQGADVVYGSAQRFGVPLGYGGPHAAFFATREAFVRQAPGRLIGVSVDSQGAPAYRMALQTREQHIRREKATSNICTAQALLANMAAFYAVFHGADGLTAIAARVHAHATRLAGALVAMGLTQENTAWFDTLRVSGVDAAALRAAAEAAQINLRYLPDGAIGISLDETTTADDVAAIASVFAKVVGRGTSIAGDVSSPVPPALRRTSAFLTHPVFTEHRSELQMTRYIRHLERRDIGLDTSMIPLGSCTMKLNAAAEMLPITWPGFAALHPFVPVEQAAGYLEIFRDMERVLCDITGFAAVSLQPNSGAQGELAGLMVIRAYHRARGDANRQVVLIPSSAHGTNPASAVMAGMTVVVVACDADGNVDVADLRAKAERHRDALAGLMVTYPSTHGVYEDAIREICDVVHEHGGQVYMDGANMNAQVGLTSPALIGADVCHLNLHKTFAIPHGGGGPGMGPIGVAAHLAPFLPSHPLVSTGGASGIHAISAAPWGSALILLISYGYMSMLGGEGMTEATRYAILNANYVKARLEGAYPVLYTGRDGRVAHELILDLRPLKQASGIDEMDVAKRLMDYGFHAPTVSFPVPGTLMVEPTESESRDEIDRFCEAMLTIRAEIEAVIDGSADAKDNVLKHAPHTAAVCTADEWTRPYTRTTAAFPLPYLRTHKVWPAVGRVDNPYGDRNLMCACPPIAEYADEPVGA